MDTMEQLRALLEEEPKLELDFPRVFVQPKIDTYCLNKYNAPQLLSRIKKSLKKKNGEEFTRNYNQLIIEFRPILNWAFSCWDYLLTTEGIRYLLRPEGERLYCHGDYRAFTDKDYHRLIYKVFKECTLSYNEKKDGKSFISYLKKNFWNKIIKEYKELENPIDQRQRKLTHYSYLRCTPYEFLNSYHQEIVNTTLMHLEREEKEIVDLYFLNFLKEEEIAKIKNITLEEFLKLKEKVLHKISLLNPLVYALLLQIERY